MRLRLIGVLAALLMLAPVAGFARTSTPVVQPTVAHVAKSSKKKKKKETAKKKTKHAKQAKHAKHAKKKGATKGKKEGQKGSR